MLKKLLVFLLLVFIYFVVEASTITTPYRTKSATSIASVQLRGVAGTATEGDTLQGSYNSAEGMFEFDIATSGFYTKWEDLTGGTNYSRNTSWSTAEGKYLTGGDIQRAFIDMNNLTPADTTRYSYPGLISIIMADSAEPQPSRVFGMHNYTETVVDTTIYLANGTMVDLPGSYKLVFDDRRQTYHGDMLFRCGNDSNITFTGGEITSACDSNTWAISKSVFSGFVGDSLMMIGMPDIAKDSLANWFVYNSTTGRNNRVAGNGNSNGSFLNVAFQSAWNVDPVPGDVLQFSPYTQWQHAIFLQSCKNITIKDMYIHHMPGDAVAINGGENITIDNCIFEIPTYHHSRDLYDNLIGRMPISLTCNPAGPMIGPWPFGETPSHKPYLKNVKVTNSTLRGGYHTGADLEPNGTGLTIDGIWFDNCKITGQGDAFSANTSSNIKNIRVTNCDITTQGYGFFISGNDSDYVTEDILFKGNKVTINRDTPGGAGFYLRGNVKNVVIEDNDFYCADSIGPSYMIHILNFDTLGTPVGMMKPVSNIIIRNNRFHNVPRGAMWVVGYGAVGGLKNVEITGNVIMNPGYRTDIADGSISYAIICRNVANLTFSRNTIFENTGRGEVKRPATFQSCDSLIVSNNIVYGCSQSNSFYYADCEPMFASDNTFGFSTADSSSITTGANAFGYEEMPPTSALATIDTVTVDSMSLYYILSFSRSGQDTVYYWSAPSVYSSVILDSTLVDTTIRSYNDTMYVHSSDYVNTDSLSIRKALLGGRMDFTTTINYGDTAAGTGDITQEFWTVQKTIRDVIHPQNNILGVLIRNYLLATYGQASQRAVSELYVNDDSGLIYHTGDVTRVYQAIGGKFLPENLILPSDSTQALNLDGTTQYITPVDGMMYFDVSDSTIHIYSNGGWVTFDHD